MLHFIYNENVVCVLVSHDIKSGEFVLQVPYYPPVEEIADYKENHKRCLRIVMDSLLPSQSGAGILHNDHLSEDHINIV